MLVAAGKPGDPRPLTGRRAGSAIASALAAARAGVAVGNMREEQAATVAAIEALKSWTYWSATRPWPAGAVW